MNKGKTNLRSDYVSLLAETFAKKEYRSYILIDFNKASKETKSLFDDLSSLDFISQEHEGYHHPE